MHSSLGPLATGLHIGKCICVSVLNFNSFMKTIKVNDCCSYLITRWHITTKPSSVTFYSQQIDRHKNGKRWKSQQQAEQVT